MNHDRADVVIIGGGSIGTLSALYLARLGKSVILLERDRVGAQSSGASPGSLRLQGRHPVEMPLSMLSQALWESIEADIGEQVEFEQRGHVFLALTPAHMQTLHDKAGIEIDYGNHCELLGPEEVARRWPYLTKNQFGASFNPRSAVVNSRLVSPAVARCAVRAGARILEHQEVVDTRWHQGVFSTQTRDGLHIESEFLVNAAGMWARPIAQRFSEDAPMFSAGPIQMVTEPVPRFVDPVIHSVDGHIIFRQTARGNMVVAGHPRVPVDDLGRRSRVPPEKTLRNMRRLLNACPGMLPHNVIRIWTGIEGYLPDMLPVFGPSATTPGLIHAFGWSGHGLQCAPGAAQGIAELITEGRAQLDLTAFDIRRFRDAAHAPIHDMHDEFESDVERPGAHPVVET